MKHSPTFRLVAAVGILAASSTLAFAAPGNLPALHRQGDVAYLSGGIGLGQSGAIKEAMHRYPLSLEFAGKTQAGNEYLADIPVRITGPHGDRLLQATAHGPFMLASLPDGRYDVSATYNGETQHRSVDIGPSTHARELFLWSM